MAGSFFDFDTALPAGIEDDAANGPENEEEAYDALNDETFGTAIEDDWEQGHEHLTKITDTSRWKDDYNDVNHNDDLRNGQDHLEASLSQLVLEDNDDDTIHRRTTASRLPHSNLALYPDSPSALRNSVWAVGKHDGPLSASSPIRSRSNLPQGVKSVCTVEELERNLMQMRSGNVGAPGLPPPPGLGNPSPGGALRLEDLERKITQSTPQNRLNLVTDLQSRLPPGLGRGNLLNALQNQRLMGAPGHVEAPKVPLQQLPLGFNSSNLPPHLTYRQQHTFQPIHPGPGILPLGPHHSQQHLPFNMNGPRIPPPFHVNNHLPPHLHQQHPPHHQHMPHQQHRNAHHHLQQQQQHHHHHQQQHQLQQQHHHHQQHHRINGAGDYDEYAGLMTPWQKQWLLNIQTLQLNVGVPYVVDYYYTVYKTRKERRDSESNHSGDRLLDRPESAKLGKDCSESMKSGRERPPSVMGPAKAYTPLQFENSLGKLQCVSVSAPRKLIDMEIMSSDGQEGQSSQRDLKKTKQLLLEIERLYIHLLELEDAFDPQAIEAAAEAAVARALRDPPDPEPEPEKASPEELLQRMTSVLLQGDKILGFMGIRKGKTFLLRLLPHVPPNAGLHFAFWGQVLVGLSAIAKRDQADGLLYRFLPELKRWLSVCDLAHILKLTTSLVAEASLKSKSSRSSLTTAVNSKFGVLALGTILSSTERYLDEITGEQKDRWVEFLSALAGVAETARITEDNSIRRSLPVTPETLQRHLDACGSAITNSRGAFLKRLFLSDSLKTEANVSDKTKRAADSSLPSLIN